MKKPLGQINGLYPLPTVLVGANVDGKPNYTAIAHLGVMDFTTVSLSMGRVHHTNKGIQQNATFSINIPSIDHVRETDYCGLISGRDADKAALFETFYGKLETAPMIRNFPVTMECRVIQTVQLARHDGVIGEIVETWCDEACLTEGRIDFTKVRPILFAFSAGTAGYFTLGDSFATPWDAGKPLLEKQ